MLHLRKKSKPFYLFLFLVIPSFVWAQKDSKDLPVYRNPHYSFQERAADLVSRMTLSEEIMQFRSKNKWIKSDINASIAERHAAANNVLEAVRNDGSFVDLNHVRVHYYSSNQSVASVTYGGIVKANAPGVATIKATVNGVSGSTAIVVKQRPE